MLIMITELLAKEIREKCSKIKAWIFLQFSLKTIKIIWHYLRLAEKLIITAKEIVYGLFPLN